MKSRLNLGNAHYYSVQNLLSSRLISKNLKIKINMGEGRGVHRVLFGRPNGKRPLGRPRHRREDNIKMDLREIGIDGANWVWLTQDRVQWRAFAKMIMYLWVP
jgi:hypothetical protein